MRQGVSGCITYATAIIINSHIVEYTYDAWGNPISTRTLTTSYDALAELNPFRYRGYVWDTESERYYVSSRYFKPEFIRWSNADGNVSTGQGVIGCNMYAYCNNNPVIFKDPSGHAMMWVLIMALGMATILGGCAKTEPEPLPYKSADEAAKAFSEQVYSSCSYIRHEYATEIYSLTVNGQTTYGYNEQ